MINAKILTTEFFFPVENMNTWYSRAKGDNQMEQCKTEYFRKKMQSQNLQDVKEEAYQLRFLRGGKWR